MKRITITVDDELAERIAEYEADGNDVSALVSELLREHFRQMADYGEAMEHFLSLEPLSLGGAPYPTRDELHRRSAGKGVSRSWEDEGGEHHL